MLPRTDFAQSPLLRMAALIAVIVSSLCNTQSVTAEVAKRPFLIGSVRSLDSVRDNVKHLFDSAGHPEKARTLEALFLLATAGRGTLGLDTTRPCGFAYDLEFIDDEPKQSVWYFLPVSDNNGFVQLMRVFAQDLELRKPGLYRFGRESDFRLKLSDGWAFIYEASKTDPVFPDPAKMIGKSASSYDAAISIDMSLIPAAINQKLQELGGIQTGVNSNQNLLDQVKQANPLLRTVSELHRDCKEFLIGFRSSGKDGAVIDFEFTPRGGTPSATWIADSSRTPNRFATLVEDDALISSTLSIPVDYIRAVIQSTLTDDSLDALLKRWIAGGRNVERAEFIAKWKKPLLALLKTNAAAKQFDIAFSCGGPKRPSILVHQLDKARELEQFLLGLIQLSRSDVKEIISPGIAVHAGQDIHAVSWPASINVDDNTKKLIGDARELHVAFLKDAVIYTAGPGSLTRMKAAIETFQTPRTPTDNVAFASPFNFNLALGALLQGATGDDEFTKMARENFKTDDGFGVAVEFLRDRCRLRLEFGEAYPRFLGKLYAIGYEKYLLPQTIDGMPVADVGFSLLGLIASLPIGLVEFQAAPSYQKSFRTHGGVVGGNVPQFKANDVQYNPLPLASKPTTPIARPHVHVKHTKQDIPVLLDGLKYRDAQVRIKSAQMIGQLGANAKDAVPALIEALARCDGHPSVYANGATREAQQIARALAKIGPAAVPHLAQSIASRKQAVVNAVSQSLRTIKSIDTATPTLINILKNPKAETWRKETAISLIGTIGKPAADATPTVMTMLKSGDWANRRSLIECVQKLGDPPAEVIDILIEMTNLKSVKSSSVQPTAYVQSVSYRSLQNETDQHWALKQLALAREQAVPATSALIQLLRADNNQTRLLAIRAIGEIGPSARAALPALKRASELERLLNGVNQDALAQAIAKIESTGNDNPPSR